MARCVWVGNISSEREWGVILLAARDHGGTSRIQAPAAQRWAKLTMKTPHGAAGLIQSIGSSPVRSDGGGSKPVAMWARQQPVPHYNQSTRDGDLLIQAVAAAADDKGKKTLPRKREVLIG